MLRPLRHCRSDLWRVPARPIGGNGVFEQEWMALFVHGRWALLGLLDLPSACVHLWAFLRTSGFGGSLAAGTAWLLSPGRSSDRTHWAQLRAQYSMSFILAPSCLSKTSFMWCEQTM